MTPLPPLNPLKMFEAAGRLLSISKAAEELFVTPAAVSRQIRVLEEFLNFQLFRREHGACLSRPRARNTCRRSRPSSWPCGRPPMPRWVAATGGACCGSARRPPSRCDG
ncbi:LysR family transcriptional regulator [Variovorax paradoxus]|uniref:LysR family transcriptional regulator n=1 Tax=Variovorax paradoxus TaxID=34073 RepID=UPI0038CF47B0